MNKRILITIGILVVVILLPGADVMHIHKPAPTEKTLKEEAKNKISQVKVAILYERVSDGIYYLNRSVDDVINILRETKTDFIFRAWWRKYPCPESPDTQSDFFPSEYIKKSVRRGYTYEHLRNAIANIKKALPDIMFCGAVSCQWVNKRERDPITGETFDMDETWAMALDPGKWNISMSKEEFQERFAKGHQWIEPDERYDHTKVWAYFPDITNPDFQELLLDLAKKQINCGADAIWIDFLFNQARYLAKITKDLNHPAVKESFEAASKIVDEIHNYGYSKGKYICVGSWAGCTEYPYPPPDLDFVTPTLSSAEIYSREIYENFWDTRIKKIREKMDNIPIFAHMDFGLKNLPLTVFAQYLSTTEQREFLKYADGFFQKKGLIFIYPVHGGWMGKNPKKLAFGKFNVYDSLAPEFQTYQIIKELAQKKSKIKPPLTTLKRSYVKLVDGNPQLFIGDKETEITGFFMTSDPYKNLKGYENVIKYIDKAAEYNFTFVCITLSWWWLDQSKQSELPHDAGKLIAWTKLDKIFDYAASKGVYLVPYFRYNVLPKWWYKLTPNPTQYVQTNSDGKRVPMMSFNVPEHQKYAEQVITTMVNRYKNHPALLGWYLHHGYTNENNYPGGPRLRHGSVRWYDYSEFAKRRFRKWLRERYHNNVSSLQKAWGNSSVTFENAEMPQPLPEITTLGEMIEWINGPGDTRRQWYDWQLFRLEEKKLLRDHFAKLYKTLDPDHILMATASPPLTGRVKGYIMSMDYYDYIFSPYIDIVLYHPGVTDDLWENPIRKNIPYNFVKYYETRGKAAFIKWEGDQRLTPGNLKPLKGCAEFARKTGTGIALWEGNIPTEDGAGIQPEFTDIQIKAVAETFHSTPEGRLKKSSFAIIEDPTLCAFDYRAGSKKLKKFSDYKARDMLIFKVLLNSAGLEYDVISTNEILKNPDILKNYKAVALINLYRMNNKLLEILLEFHNSGGGLFIVGRTGFFDEYGNKNTTYLRKLLGVNNVYEKKKTRYRWSFIAKKNPLLDGIEGEKIGNGESLLYIPTFNYEKEGYEVLGRLDENPKIATVGYKGKVVFWFPRLGMQVMNLNKEELETIEQFLRNLYDFYGIQGE